MSSWTERSARSSARIASNWASSSGRGIRFSIVPGGRVALGWWASTSPLSPGLMPAARAAAAAAFVSSFAPQPGHKRAPVASGAPVIGV